MAEQESDELSDQNNGISSRKAVSPESDLDGTAFFLILSLTHSLHHCNSNFGQEKAYDKNPFSSSVHRFRDFVCIHSSARRFMSEL